MIPCSGNCQSMDHCVKPAQVCKRKATEDASISMVKSVSSCFTSVAKSGPFVTE